MEVKNFWNSTTVTPNGQWVTDIPDFKETVIVGAGGAGLSTAILLVARGYKDLVVLDAILPSWRGARKGIGAATLSPKPLHYLLSNNINIVDAVHNLRMANIGIKNINSFIQRFWPEKDWCRKLNYGGFHIATSKEDELLIGDCHRYYKTGEIQSSLMSSKSIANLTGINNQFSGIFVPNEMTVNPAKFFNGIITQIRKMGVDVLSGFCVSSINQDGIHWEISDEMGNMLRCRKLVICTGPNLSALPSIDDLEDSFCRKRITYAATPIIGSHRLHPYILSTLDGSEIYRRYDNRIIAAVDSTDYSSSDLKQPSKNAIQWALNRISTLYPLVESEKTFEFVWSKNILDTKDSLPIVSEVPSLKNLYLNMGYNHHSIGMQMIGGAVMAELLLGSNQAPGTELFSLERFLR